MRILVAEDDKILGAGLKRALELRGYGVDWFADGESALTSLRDNAYTLAILDINLPKLSGIEVLKRTRQTLTELPIMLLTARDTTEQKVEGLDSGADDYLVKPFELDELLARVRALTRRHEKRRSHLLRCGKVTLDLEASVVRYKGKPVELTAREYRLLKLLMERADKYVTKNDIEYALYDAENMSESNTIEVVIYNLRRKFGSTFIRSMRGVGYMVMQ